MLSTCICGEPDKLTHTQQATIIPIKYLCSNKDSKDMYIQLNHTCI